MADTSHSSTSVASPVVDHDEYGRPVRDRYLRLGAGSVSADDVGLYVRFEPGFGLNVHLGVRKAFYDQGHQRWQPPSRVEDVEGLVLPIEGWRQLCTLVDEWRAREAAS